MLLKNPNYCMAYYYRYLGFSTSGLGVRVEVRLSLLRLSVSKICSVLGPLWIANVKLQMCF